MHVLRIAVFALLLAGLPGLSSAADSGLGFGDNPLIRPNSPLSVEEEERVTGAKDISAQDLNRLRQPADPRGAVQGSMTQKLDEQTSSLTSESDPEGLSAASRLTYYPKTVEDLGPEAMTVSGPQWLQRDYHATRLGENLISDQALARPPGIDHQLRPGDIIRVVAWGGVTLNDSMPVDAAGNLAVPGFGAIPVAGSTQQQAQENLVELLQSHFRNAGAIVAVESAADQAVIVTGAVGTPGYLRLPPGGTVLEALAAAGGVEDVGSLRQITVREPGQDARAVDLYPLLLNGDAEVLKPLVPGSSIHVPLAAVQVNLFGAVRRPHRIEVPAGASLADVLAAAGGLAPGADPETLRLARESSQGLALELLTVDQLSDRAASDGDRLLVSLKHDADGARAVVSIDGAVRTPGSHPFQPGMTIGQLLIAAGGLRPGADASDIVIRRVLAEPVMIELASGLQRPVFHDLVVNPRNDTPLQALDHITVPLGAVLEDQLAAVTISGAVVEPGTKPLVPGLTLRDLLSMGGGLLPEAQVDQADLVRSIITNTGERNVERLSVDLRPIIDGRSPGPELMNFDVVVVRSRIDERVSVTIEGEVLNTGELVLPGGTTLSEAISIAGGLTERAFPEGAQFFRLSEQQAAENHLEALARRLESSITINQQQLQQVDEPDEERMLRKELGNQQAELARMQRATATGRMAGIRLSSILGGDAVHDFELRDGDRLVIPPRPGTIRVLGEVMVPGSLRHEAGVKPLEAISRSGGLTRQADDDLIFVVRANGSVVASAAFSGTSWDPEERRWVRTKLKNIELAEGDTVIIPPDLRYKPGARVLARDWSQVLFQVAGAVGTIAVLSDN